MNYCAPTTPDFKLHPRAYRGVHQDAVDARRARQSVGFAGARSAVAEAAAGRGLVSVSTSGFDAVSTPQWWADNCITIDRAQARCTRLRKGVGTGAKALLNLGEGRAENNVMVTLTYRGDNRDWAPRHVSDYIRKVREWFKDRCPGERLRYVWVAELQQRGVIHYHAVFFLPQGVSMPQADKRGWWPHGMTNTLKATAPVAYLMKYASKIESKSVGGFPRGSRIYGIGGLDAPGAAFKRWCLWPAYVQGNASVNDRFRPAKGGGYVDAATGVVLRSEYAPTGAGFRSFVRVRTQARAVFVDAEPRLAPSGPFSWLGDAPRVH